MADKTSDSSGVRDRFGTGGGGCSGGPRGAGERGLSRRAAHSVAGIFTGDADPVRVKAAVDALIGEGLARLEALAGGGAEASASSQDAGGDARRARACRRGDGCASTRSCGSLQRLTPEVSRPAIPGAGRRASNSTSTCGRCLPWRRTRGGRGAPRASCCTGLRSIYSRARATRKPSRSCGAAAPSTSDARAGSSARRPGPGQSRNTAARDGAARRRAAAHPSRHGDRRVANSGRSIRSWRSATTYWRRCSRRWGGLRRRTRSSATRCSPPSARSGRIIRRRRGTAKITSKIIAAVDVIARRDDAVEAGLEPPSPERLARPDIPPPPMPGRKGVLGRLLKRARGGRKAGRAISN